MSEDGIGRTYRIPKWVRTFPDQAAELGRTPSHRAGDDISYKYDPVIIYRRIIHKFGVVGEDATPGHNQM